VDCDTSLLPTLRWFCRIDIWWATKRRCPPYLAVKAGSSLFGLINPIHPLNDTIRSQRYAVTERSKLSNEVKINVTLIPIITFDPNYYVVQFV
jgi:hypothetical protein